MPRWAPSAGMAGSSTAAHAQPAAGRLETRLEGAAVCLHQQQHGQGCCQQQAGSA